MSFFGLFKNKRKDQASALKDVIVAEKKEDVKSLQDLNKKFKLILEKGNVEITIKNVRGVLEELK